MKTVLSKLKPPVLAFLFVIVAGWVLCLTYGEWWWLAGAIPLALVAGDLAEAVFRQPEPEKAKGKRTTKKGP